MTQPLPALTDPGNTHLAMKLPVSIVTGKAPVPGGETGIVTIRHANTTLTLDFDRDTAAKWAEVFGQLRDMLSGSGKIAVANQPGIIAAVSGQTQ